MDNEAFDQIPDELLDMLLALLSGQAELHFVEVEFSYGTCLGCGQPDRALLPIGPDDRPVCHECGQQNQDNLREFLKQKLFRHMRGHAAQWN